MSKLRVNAFGISIDGYGAGVDQDLNNPMGLGGMALHNWVFGTKTFRAPITMEGGTTFHFVTDGIHPALARAKEVAQGKDVRLGGGVAAVRQYLTAGLIDEIHLAISPVLLGRGEHLLAGIDTVSLGYKCMQHAATDHATHVVLAKER